MMRLDKLLAHMGYGTRSELKKAVKQGRVTVDGKQVKDSGLVLDAHAAVVCWDEQLVRYREVVYFMLNKPQGVISATEDYRERTVIDLLDAEDQVLQPFPVGRLDKDTEGLLLLTNDGQLAHELLSPRKHVDKVYEAVVHGEVGDAEIRGMASGVALDDGYVTMPARLLVDNREIRDDGEVYCSITLTIQEGKFHQVKRMFEALGRRVVYLRRIAMGPLTLDEGLALGAYRELLDEEVEMLRQHRVAKAPFDTENQA
ncbi:rRNA pseudouridine synthase [Paenibacillaceae bacterium]|nr:rRNA pseudouridine synthase [Paenibacillaceae bacterium]